jgi:hypothetical protein
LSGMNRKVHVPFLGGPEGNNAPRLPDPA